MRYKITSYKKNSNIFFSRKFVAFQGQRLLVFTLGVFLIFSSFSMVTFAQETPWHIEMVSHRGYSHYYPDNTLTAFQAAIDAGAKAVELDVRKTSDGAFVIYHDDTVAKLTGKPNDTTGIKKYTLEQVKSFDNGAWFDEKFVGEQIPTLDEALALFEGTDVTIYVELKDVGRSKKFPQDVYWIVKSHGLLNQVVFSSFKYSYLKQIKALNYSQPVMKLTGTASLDLAKRCPADYYGINMAACNPTVVRVYHEAGALVYAYTPQNAVEGMSLQNMGVDGFITDYVSADELVVPTDIPIELIR